MVDIQVEASAEVEVRREMLGATIKRVGAMIEIIGVMIEREHHINKEKVIIMKEMEMINTTIINIQMVAS